MSMFSEQNAGQYIVVSEPVSDPSQVSGRVELFNEDGSPFSGGGGGGAPTFSDIPATTFVQGPAVNFDSVRGAKLGKLVFLHFEVSLPDGWPGGSGICDLPQEWKPARTHVDTGTWTADDLPDMYVIPFIVPSGGGIVRLAVVPGQTTANQTAYFTFHTSYEAFS